MSTWIRFGVFLPPELPSLPDDWPNDGLVFITAGWFNPGGEFDSQAPIDYFGTYTDANFIFRFEGLATWEPRDPEGPNNVKLQWQVDYPGSRLQFFPFDEQPFPRPEYDDPRFDTANVHTMWLFEKDWQDPNNPTTDLAYWVRDTFNEDDAQPHLASLYYLRCVSKFEPPSIAPVPS